MVKSNEWLASCEEHAKPVRRTRFVVVVVGSIARQDIMTYAKQTCAYITQHSGPDKTRLRFIELLIHATRKYSDPDATFECSACTGFSDYKFCEDTEVVKQVELQRFLEAHFGVSPSATADLHVEPMQPRKCVEPCNEDEDDDDGGGGNNVDEIVAAELPESAEEVDT